MARSKIQNPYYIIDSSGIAMVAPSRRLKEVREICVDYDESMPAAAPHRVGVLVTLEELAIVRLAKKYVLATQEARGGCGTQCAASDAWRRLEKTVEAARGK